jgi:hypothetical protein
MMPSLPCAWQGSVIGKGRACVRRVVTSHVDNQSLHAARYWCCTELRMCEHCVFGQCDLIYGLPPAQRQHACVQLLSDMGMYQDATALAIKVHPSCVCLTLCSPPYLSRLRCFEVCPSRSGPVCFFATDTLLASHPVSIISSMCKTSVVLPL